MGEPDATGSITEPSAASPTTPRAPTLPVTSPCRPEAMTLHEHLTRSVIRAGRPKSVNPDAMIYPRPSDASSTRVHRRLGIARTP